ncbi:hypothetical protein AURDEDRAFT_129840 [Auricularia subglabra TFB-10046 SS5]|nr:hypothetical protein AURDEDRAFT_129840 [Auricularia subglabra TFB-10046 SS5]
MASQNWNQKTSAEALGLRSLPPSPEGNATTTWAPAAGGSGWPDPSPIRQPPPWLYDAHPNGTSWNATAAGHAAALILSAAYTHAHITGENAPQVDMHWHRPDQGNVEPLGHGPRGDVALDDVHGAMDVVLEGRRSLSDLEVRLLHAWLDRVWLLHSRAPHRAVAALRQLGVFDAGEVDILWASLRGSPLTDFRLVMLAVDPRETPVYGRTRDGPGISRLFRRFSIFSEWGQASATTDHELWDEDDGGASGSSAEGQQDVAPFHLTALQRQSQRIRHAVRRIRRVTETADKAEKLAMEQEQRMADEVERSHLGAGLLKVLESVRRVAEQGENLPQRTLHEVCVFGDTRESAVEVATPQRQGSGKRQVVFMSRPLGVPLIICTLSSALVLVNAGASGRHESLSKRHHPRDKGGKKEREGLNPGMCTVLSMRIAWHFEEYRDVRRAASKSASPGIRRRETGPSRAAARRSHRECPARSRCTGEKEAEPALESRDAHGAFNAISSHFGFRVGSCEQVGIPGDKGQKETECAGIPGCAQSSEQVDIPGDKGQKETECVGIPGCAQSCEQVGIPGDKGQKETECAGIPGCAQSSEQVGIPGDKGQKETECAGIPGCAQSSEQVGIPGDKGQKETECAGIPGCARRAREYWDVRRAINAIAS